MRRAPRFDRSPIYKCFELIFNIMKLITRFFLLSLVISPPTLRAAPSDTDRYVAFLADLLERKSIGDDELVLLVENAAQGLIINPISQDRADTGIIDFIDYE